MAARSLWRAKGKLLLAATAVGGAGAAAVAVANSEDPATALKLSTSVPIRLLRGAATAATIAFDYEYSLWGLPEDSIERERAKREVHTRSALRLQELCFKNGDIHQARTAYKSADEYVKIMRESLLNRCPVSSYDQVLEVFKKELGGLLMNASLAQVHIARTHDGQKVAVKVQHTHMTDTAAADYATVELIVNTLHRFFPSFDYRWLVDEVQESLPKELDFLIEAKNSIKCMDNFRRLSPHIAEYVYAPEVHWNLSTSKLLVMEFIDGAQVNDCRAIEKLGIRPSDVSILLSQAFAEMMFKHGFVHCDPHAANVLVRPLPSGSRSIFGKKKPQLVLLDHGLYKELDSSMRINYASLWKGLVFSDANAIKENSVKIGAGEDLYVLFAGILTMRPWNKVIDPAVDHLVVKGTDTDRSELQMYASQYFPQITELLRRLPRVILLMLKTNDCLRAVNRALLEGSSLETFLIVGRVSSEAVIESKLLQSRSLLSRLLVWFEELRLEARLFAMQIALWLLKLQKTLTLHPFFRYVIDEEQDDNHKATNTTSQHSSLASIDAKAFEDELVTAAEQKNSRPAEAPVCPEVGQPSKPLADGQPVPDTTPFSAKMSTNGTEVGNNDFRRFLSELESTPLFAAKAKHGSRPKNVLLTKDMPSATATAGPVKETLPVYETLPASEPTAGAEGKAKSFAGLFSSNRKLSDENKLTKFAVEPQTLELGVDDLIDVRTKLGYLPCWLHCRQIFGAPSHTNTVEDLGVSVPAA
ncbi:putative ABC1 protein [Sesamum angolense]|uniref:ABC1 protein n=1 Tax=Sesamum angolense TaxID=2727404 RepID=A0AAE2BZE8_9LAMI|nr:putative ABC1 protein [Sesamum angolense]